jgi:hypothetical protein
MEIFIRINSDRMIFPEETQGIRKNGSQCLSVICFQI